jgi:hypothetical protein
MNGMVAVTEFAGAYPLFGGFGFRGGTIFIGTANIERFVGTEPAEPGKTVGGEHLNKIPQMRHVVHVGKSGSY